MRKFQNERERQSVNKLLMMEGVKSKAYLWSSILTS